MRLGDDEWEQADEDTWRLSLKNLQETDRFQAMGPGNVPMHLHLEPIYTRTPGTPTLITPQSTDPLGPLNWAGLVWNGSATSTFTARTDDGRIVLKMLIALSPGHGRQPRVHSRMGRTFAAMPSGSLPPPRPNPVSLIVP